MSEADRAEILRRADSATELARAALRAAAESATGPRPVGALAVLAIQLAEDVRRLLAGRVPRYEREPERGVGVGAGCRGEVGSRGPTEDEPRELGQILDDVRGDERHDLWGLVECLASLAGTFDLGDEPASRPSTAALLAIRSALMERELWPPRAGSHEDMTLWTPHARDAARVKDLFEAADRIEHGDRDAELAGVVWWAARLIGGMPEEGPPRGNVPGSETDVR